jgi:hypothetical protein
VTLTSCAVETSPLEGTLQRVAARSDRWHARLGVPDEPGWLTPAAVLDRLDELIGRVAAAYRTDDAAVAGTFFLNGYARAAIGVALVTLATERRVPDVAPGNVALFFPPSGIAREIALVTPSFAALPDDPADGHPGAIVVPDVEALRGWLRDRFVGGHIGALVEPLRARTRRGPRAIWATASDMCSGALAILAQESGSSEALDAEVRAFLSNCAPLVEATPLSAGWRRRTCCLAYRLPGYGLCSSCPCLEPRPVL